MNRISRWMIVLINMLVVALAGYTAFAAEPEKQTITGNQTVVRVAANLPFTGALATYGKEIQNGAIMALEDLKKADEGGHVIEVDWQDNAGSPQTAVTVMQKQFLNPPDICVTGIKPQFMAVGPQISAKGTPNFAWIFDMFINKDTNNNFRTLVSYKIEAKLLLDYAASRKVKRVAILYAQLPHAHEEFQVAVVPGLKEQGLKDSDIMLEPFDFEKKEFKDIALKVRKFKPNLIILSGFDMHMIGLVRAMRPLSIIGKGNTIGTYDLLKTGKVLGKDELEGILVVTPQFITRPNQKKFAEWLASYNNRFELPSLYFAPCAYDMIMAINDAARRLKLPATSDQWIAALRATDLTGVTGPLKFDKDGDLEIPCEIGVFRDGNPVPRSR